MWKGGSRRAATWRVGAYIGAMTYASTLPSLSRRRMLALGGAAAAAPRMAAAGMMTGLAYRGSA